MSRDSRLANAALLFVGAIAAAVIVGSALWTLLSLPPTQSRIPGRIVFALDSDAYLQPTLQSFTRDGFERVSDVGQLQHSINAQTTVVVFTRASLAQTGAATLSDLFDRGVVIAGLDVSLAEMHAAGVDVTVGSARLKHSDSPSRPIFSVVACHDQQRVLGLARQLGGAAAHRLPDRPSDLRSRRTTAETLCQRLGAQSP